METPPDKHTRIYIHVDNSDIHVARESKGYIGKHCTYTVHTLLHICNCMHCSLKRNGRC